MLCLLSAEFWAVKAQGVDLVLRAVGGGWSAFGSCGRVLKVEWWYCLAVFFVYLLFAV